MTKAIQAELFPAESEFNSQTAKIRNLNRAAKLIHDSKQSASKGRPSKDLHGKRYGKLTVIGKVQDDSTPYQVWLCACDCGQVIKATATHLRTLTHCGCEGYGRGRIVPGALGYRGKVGNEMFRGGRNEDAAFKQLLFTYIYNAKKRGLSWVLTEQEFETLTTSDCHYCKEKPNQVMKLANSQYTYNGIDRKDSSLGYELENVVPCCGKCNILKGSIPYGEFLKHIQTIAGA